jgi:hypothetical protein
LGHELFKSTPDTFSVPFIQGDVFNSSHLAIVPPTTHLDVSSPPLSSLKDLTSLNQLRGRVSAIHASAFFHLFSESEQLHLARALGGLLSPEPNSIIFGQHGSNPTNGWRSIPVFGNNGRDLFCHNPESWTELWDGGVFEKGTVRVECVLDEVERPDYGFHPGMKFYQLTWAVIRM